MSRGRKVVVVGSGGREHALTQALLESNSVQEVVVTPGNAGTHGPSLVPGKTLRNVKGRAFDVAIAEKPDLVVIGPEQPLCEGLADALSAQDLLVYGPSGRASRLEGSKSFMKEFATKIGLVTARHVVVSDVDELPHAVAQFSEPPVVKADGLCAGKGVALVDSPEEACAAARKMLSGQAFGDAGRKVVLEERLRGEEVSIHAVCDGQRAILLPAAQDHKRIFDGDQGPNTGGMGSYAPAPIISDELLRRIDREIVNRVLDGMRAEGCPFRGTLFAGLMISGEGIPQVLEFNVRFGDPETQVLMNVIEGDLCELLITAARGNLDPTAVRILPNHALCVVMAAMGYPAEPRKGDSIGGLSEASARPNVRVYHAGTALDGGHMVTAGGRVLGITGFASTLQKAAHYAYSAVDCITFEGRQFRHDIGHRALTTSVG
jgi:phosphoribosylamine--glycine ligase